MASNLPKVTVPTLVAGANGGQPGVFLASAGFANLLFPSAEQRDGEPL